jgi:hypothetical protein
VESAAATNKRNPVKQNPKPKTVVRYVEWNPNLRDELAKIVSEIVNAPKGTPLSGSQPIRRDA